MPWWIVLIIIVCGLVILYIAIGFILRYIFCSQKSLTKIKKKNADINTDFSVQRDERWIKSQCINNIMINSYDNKKIRAHFIANCSHIYVIYAHGWMGDCFDKTTYLKEIYINQKANLLLIEQRGQNSSKIKYISMGYKEGKDVISWTKWIINNDHEAKIFLYGQSMGAATILYAMNFDSFKEIKGYIEDCGYTSIRKQFFDTASQAIPKTISFLFTPSICIAMWLTGCSFIKYNPITGVRKNKKPLLIIHGENDELVPFENALIIEKESKNTNVVEKYLLKNGKHACVCIVDPDQYIKVINNFLSKYSN